MQTVHWPAFYGAHRSNIGRRAASRRADAPARAPDLATSAGLRTSEANAADAAEATGMPKNLFRWLPLAVPGMAILMCACLGAVLIAVL